jgi:hypothetical protein
LVSRHDRTKDYPPTLIIPRDDDDEKILRMYRKEKAALANNAEHDDSDQTETPAAKREMRDEFASLAREESTAEHNR